MRALRRLRHIDHLRHMHHPAHQSGAKGDAHKHSVASKQHRHDMEQENLRAVAAILEPQGWKTSRKLDLHGLHVKEAEHAVEDFLKCVALRSLRPCLTITIARPARCAVPRRAALALVPLPFAHSCLTRAHCHAC